MLQKGGIAMANGVAQALFSVLVLTLAFYSVAASEHVAEAEAEAAEDLVLVLDASNFTDTVQKHPFIVVEFYAPWCGHCKHLAPEYQKAASILKDHDPPIVLAKVDANEEKNKGLASEYGVRGFPTLKIVRNKGSKIDDYNGPRESDGIVTYLKKQAGPPSAELLSAEQAKEFLTKNEIAIIGLFKTYDSEEFVNFTAVADGLRADCEWGHTLDASIAAVEGNTLNVPAVRLFKSFDERLSDTSDFSVEGLKAFIEEKSYPLVTLMSQDPSMRRSLTHFFNSPDSKAYFMLDFSASKADEYKNIYSELAALTKGKLKFLLIDSKENGHVLEHFGLTEESVPSIVVQDVANKKYLLKNAEPNQLKSFIQGFIDGKLEEWIKSEPIPEINDGPVKVVVRNSIDDFVLNSGKDVLIEFYAPWCGHCKKLAPTLEEIGEHFKDDSQIMIAKMDATANDVPSGLFDVTGFPTIYLYSADKQVVAYDGDRSKEDIIKFINENRSSSAKKSIVDEEDAGKKEARDEL